MKALHKTVRRASIITLLFLSMGLTQAQNNSLKFNGSSDYLTMGNINLPISSELTVMAWVRWDINPSSGNPWANMITCNATNSGDHGRFWFQHSNNNKKFEFAIKTTSGRRFLMSSTKPVQGVWYHIAATFDGSKIKLYVNGVLEKTRNHTGTILSHNNQFYTSIGQWAHSSNNNRRFNGTIDNVSIWDIALDEFAINENMCQVIDELNPNIVAVWKMNETAGIQIFDESTNAFDGNIFGAVRILNDDGACNPLPVDLLEKQIKCVSTGSLLTWTTASELNNEYFTIEKSDDLLDWKIVTTVSGAFNSNREIEYSAIDSNMVPDKSTYYRLKQTDFNGDFKYFDVLSILCSFDNQSLEIIGVNASANSINLITKTNGLTAVTVFLTDINGRLVSKKQMNPIKGANIISLETQDLPKGIYIATIQQGTESKYKKIYLSTQYK